MRALWHPERTPLTSRPRVATALLASAASVVSLVAAELLLRGVAPGAERYYVHPTKLNRVFPPASDLLPGVSGPASFALSSDGVRAEERSPDDAVRVLAVGGSTTECLYLDQGEARPARLQRLQNAGFAPGLRTWVEIARRHGSRVVLMTQPSLYRPDLGSAEAGLLWMGGVGDFNREPGHAYYSIPAMAAAFRAYNAVVRERCRALEVECIGLAAQIPRDTSALYDDVHLNEAGAERVARALYEHLRARPPFAG